MHNIWNHFSQFIFQTLFTVVCFSIRIHYKKYMYDIILSLENFCVCNE